MMLYAFGFGNCEKKIFKVGEDSLYTRYLIITKLLVILGGYGGLMNSYLTGNSSSASTSSDLSRALLPGLPPYWTPPHTTPSLTATESMYSF